MIAEPGEPRRRRVVVATPDTLKQVMAGPAIRAWQIATALAADHEVRLVTTSEATTSSPLFSVSSVDRSKMRELEAWCDVIVLQGYVMHDFPFLVSSDKVVVVDIYDPIHLEQLEQARDHEPAERAHIVHVGTEVLNQQLLRGDYFLCASEKQRDFWIGQLAGLGRVNPLVYDEDPTLRSLIDVAPFGLPAEPPVPGPPALRGVVPGIGVDDEIILWGGGIYNWFDPLTLLRAVAALRDTHPRLRLYFMGLRHPNPTIPQMRMAVATKELAAELGLEDVHVFFNEGWVAYDDRQRYLLDADVGVSTHLDHVEATFSFRTRVLDYIWAGLPVVVTEGDSLAVIVQERDLGLTVPPGDVDALVDALHRMLTDADLRRRCHDAAVALRPAYAWDVALEPLVRFCRAPRRAPDLVDEMSRWRLRQRPGQIPRRQRRNVRVELEAIARQYREGGLRRLGHRLVARTRAAAGR